MSPDYYASKISMTWTSLYVSFDLNEPAKASQLCMYDLNEWDKLFCNIRCLWVYHCLLLHETDKFNISVYWIRVFIASDVCGFMRASC